MIGRFADGILSVAAAAVAVGILSSICSEKTGPGMLIRMLCGLVLAVHILSGLMNTDFDRLIAFPESFFQSAETAAANGSQISSKAATQIIKAKTEAYILDKAEAYGAKVDVEITLSDDQIPVPTGVRIRGSLSPYVRSQLSEMMESDLGITKGKQEWIG